MRIADAQHLWHPAAPYLNTASYGLPPDPAWDALQSAQEDWRHGRTSWETWQEATGRARQAWARLVNAPVENVAVGVAVSQLVGLIAAALPERTSVVSYDNEFTSLLWPWLARGCDVRTVPLERVAHEAADVVAVSAVQSATGEVADLAALAEADALTIVDGTQAIGWLPLDASRFDAVVGAAYKWLCSPRGTSFLYLSDRLLERVAPLYAGWAAGDDVYATFYGGPLRLSPTASRLDSSPAWFSWVGTAPTLELLTSIGVERIHEHDVALANRFRDGLGLEPSNSAIVSAAVAGADEKLARAGIQAATRAGSLRASFHVYNGESDVDRALEALS